MSACLLFGIKNIGRYGSPLGGLTFSPLQVCLERASGIMLRLHGDTSHAILMSYAQQG